jgi:hypothetical protein
VTPPIRPGAVDPAGGQYGHHHSCRRDASITTFEETTMFDRMKKVVVVALGAVSVGSTLGTARAESYDFELVNLHNSASVVAAWLAPEGREDAPWKSISIQHAVAPRSTSRFTVASPSTCRFDFKVRFSDGYVQTLGNVNICDKPYLVVS